MPQLLRVARGTDARWRFLSVASFVKQGIIHVKKELVTKEDPIFGICAHVSYFSRGKVCPTPQITLARGRPGKSTRTCTQPLI